MYNSSYRQDIQNTMSNVTIDHARKLVNGIRATFLSGPPTPPVDPNLLFDVNFNDSLEVDYSIDGAALTFEPSNASSVTLNDGFVSMSNPHYIKLTQGLPAYLKHTGDQSWVFNFRAEATSSNKFLFQTCPVEDNFTQSPENYITGIYVSVHGDYSFFTFYKAPRVILVGGQVEIGNLNFNIDIQSIVITYKKVGHELRYYFNGVHLFTATAPAGNEAEVISWENSDNLYVNRFFRYSPFQPAHYHKISVYDKILTLPEIVDIYNASQS